MFFPSAGECVPAPPGEGKSASERGREGGRACIHRMLLDNFCDAKASENDIYR